MLQQSITASNAERVTMHGALSANEKTRVFLGAGRCFYGGFLGQKAKTEAGPSECLPETPHYLPLSPRVVLVLP